MGSQICKQTKENYELILDPLISRFQRCQAPQINPQIQKLFSKIKRIRPDIIDPLKDFSNKWYQSTKHKYKLYGRLNGIKPYNQCLIYQQPQLNNSNDVNTANSSQLAKTPTPTLITTYISLSYTFSPITLIIYTNNSYYIGPISSCSISPYPSANGNGLLITKDFIYQGEFKNGHIQGYGRYKTKKIQYVGYFNKNGQPNGECIEKSADGMFIGQIDGFKRKKGQIITNNNKRYHIQQRLEIEQTQKK